MFCIHVVIFQHFIVFSRMGPCVVHQNFGQRLFGSISEVLCEGIGVKSNCCKEAALIVQLGFVFRLMHQLLHHLQRQ